MKHPRVISGIALTLLWLSGCGGGVSGPPPVTSGVSPSLPLNALSEQDHALACEQLRAGVATRFEPEALKPQLCTFVAVRLTQAEYECNSVEDSCSSSAPGNAATPYDTAFGGFDPARELGCSGDASAWGACQATVAELEACLNDVLDSLDHTLNAYTCRAPNGDEADQDCGRPINPDVAIDEINPVTGQPYTCPPPPLRPRLQLAGTPSSCQALEAQCPGLHISG